MCESHKSMHVTINYRKKICKKHWKGFEGTWLKLTRISQKTEG